MKQIYAKMCRVEVTIAMINMVLSTLLIFTSAVMRSINRPINWSLELSLFLFAWCVFLSADVGLRENRLVALDLVTRYLPVRVQLCLSLLSYSLIFVFLLAMAGFGFYLSYTTRVRTFQGIPGFSYTWVTLSLPVAALLMLITTGAKLRQFYRQLSGRVPDSSSQVGGI